MTSGKSFWDKLLNSNKQRIWMWIVSSIVLFISYPGILLVYFKRIEVNYSYLSGPQSIIEYGKEMTEAVSDALAFNGALVTLGLAVLFGIGIFSYLNNKSKMDIIKSVPVSTKDTFIVDFVSGVLMYLLPMLICVVIATLTAFCWGYLSAATVGEILLGQFMNFIMFMLYYSLSVICVCITGNVVLALAGTAIVAGVPGILESIMYDLQFSFFKTADGLFSESWGYLSPISEYYTSYWQLKEYNNLSKEINMLSSEMIAWSVIAIVLIVIAYYAYRIRPAEAMNKSVYSIKLQKLIKIVFGSGAAIICGYVVYSSAGNDPVMFAIAGVVAGVLIGMAFEVVYAGDIRGAVKSIWTTILLSIVCLLFFEIYNLDIMGFDKFLPSDNQIESYAIDVNASAYNDAFDFADENRTDGSARVSWGSNTGFYRDNMYLTNIEAIRKLAEKSLNNRLYDRQDDYTRGFSVLYRRKNGSTVARCVYVDMSDTESVELLNDIIASKEWREGFFQVLAKKEVLKNYSTKVKYTDVMNNFSMKGDVEAIIEAWSKDMEKFDYYYGSEKCPCGKISITFDEQFGYTLPVYEDFTNVYGLIRAEKMYSDRKLTADDVESIDITNFHSEFWDGEGYKDYSINPEVKIVVSDKERIGELIKELKPACIYKFWSFGNNVSSNYEARINFVPGSVPVNSDMDVFNFVEDVPEWVVEETAR